jgi:hypothetical protein
MTTATATIFSSPRAEREVLSGKFVPIMPVAAAGVRV